MMDSDGRNPRKLTRKPAKVWPSAWFPGRRQMALTTRHIGSYAISIMDLDAHTPRNLSNSRVDTLFASWSSHGQQDALSPDANQEIYVMDSDGQNVRSLINNPNSDLSSACQP